MIAPVAALRAVTMPDHDEDKRCAARAAAGRVEDGMLLGLGTGSTVAFLLDALGERVADGLRIRAVGTSLATEARARELGIAVESFSPLDAVDLAIDGVDEIDPAFRAIKGGGGALLREKVVAQAATRMIAIADGSKSVDRLGVHHPVPLEVLAFARGFVASRVMALGGEPVVRPGALTDQGNPLLDCHFGAIDDPEALAAKLAAIPGVLAHGLFLGEVDVLCVGKNGTAHWYEAHRAPKSAASDAIPETRP
jgi:ribose 5-phosphate isomerase A